MSWEDEYEFSRLKSMVLTHEGKLRELKKTLEELHEFVKYVDNTAPELRTAYQVAKRIDT